MKNSRRIRFVCAAAMSVGFSLLSTAAFADTAKIEGFIESRNGETMTVKSSDSTKTVVMLTDSTQVGQVQGMLKARRKEMSMAALIPGLQVKVEGVFDKEQLVASKVSFKGNDLERAQSQHAGMHETKMQAQKNKEELEKHRAEIEEQKQANEEQGNRISANKAAVDAAVARFGQLDDYYILDEVTVYFANGKTKVDPKYSPQLLALAEKAKGANGYMIEIKGYASSSGNTELNQQLSEDRADEVTNILLQQGHIPLTRMLAPGAMGESHQVGNEKGEQGEAANRRVVVRILQNKAIAGL